MKIKNIKQLIRRFPNAELIVKTNEHEYRDFSFEVKYTSEGKWIIEMIPNSK